MTPQAKIQIVWNFIGELEQGEDKQTAKGQRKSRTAQPFDYAALQQDSITSLWVRALPGVPFLHFQFYAFPLKGDLKIRSGD